MEKNLESVIDSMIERTATALTKNRFEVHIVNDKNEAYETVKKLMPKGASVGVGGSVSLFECGIIDLLGNGDYNFYNRYDKTLSPEQVKEIQHKALSADYFLCSSNAITEEGELYNVDGMGSRVAPMIYGPENVIVVAGYNKIVPTINEAIKRLRHIASPANTRRLECKTPCKETGVCMDCHSPFRICCDYVVMGFQRVENRVKVILVKEPLGF